MTRNSVKEALSKPKTQEPAALPTETVIEPITPVVVNAKPVNIDVISVLKDQNPMIKATPSKRF